MMSTLRHETTGPDGIWRGLFVGPGGYRITASLDLGAGERISRIRGGVDALPVQAPEPTRRERFLAWITEALS